MTPWTVACQASLSITNSQNLLKLMSIELVMPPNHLILCHPLLLLPLIFYSIRIFLNKSVPCIRWPEYWRFSFSISSFNEYSGLISFSIFKKYLLIYLTATGLSFSMQVLQSFIAVFRITLGAACRIQFPGQGPCIGSTSLSHRTTREVPFFFQNTPPLPPPTQLGLRTPVPPFCLHNYSPFSGGAASHYDAWFADQKQVVQHAASSDKRRLHMDKDGRK